MCEQYLSDHCNNCDELVNDYRKFKDSDDNIYVYFIIVGKCEGIASQKSCYSRLLHRKKTDKLSTSYYSMCQCKLDFSDWEDEQDGLKRIE